MLVSLIKRDRIYDLKLPSSIYGNYWISDKDEKNHYRELINVDAKDGKWRIRSNADNKIVDNHGEIIKETTLQNLSFNYIKIEKDESLAILYCSPIYDTSVVQLGVRNVHEIYIGSDDSNQIKYSVAALSPKHALLNVHDGKWTIKDLDSDFGVYVNSIRVKEKNLENGDVIFIMGLKIVVLGDTILVNNPFGQVKTNQTVFYPYEKKLQEIINPAQEEVDVELYEESDYFFRAPRFRTVVEKEVMNIDPPPGKEKMDEMPLIYMIGPMLTMSMMSMMTAYTTLDSVIQGDRPLSQAMPSLIMALVMLTSMILWPSLNKRYQNKQKKKREEERQYKYGKYIDGKANTIDVTMKKQRQILAENYIPTAQAENIIAQKTRQLWERKIEQEDFLSLRLGLGDKPVDMDIRYPEEHFTMDEDNLRDILQRLVNKSKDLTSVPITVPLTEKYISAIVGRKEETLPFVKQLIMQMITFHSYEDLKLVFFLGESHKEYWEYVKKIPHAWSDDKEMRYFASDYENMREISSWLEQDFQSRLEKSQNQEKPYKLFTPYYIIITDDYKDSKNIEIITDALKQKNNIGFNIIVINEDLSTLPNECTTFISIANGKGGLFDSELSSSKQHEFVLDNYNEENMLPCIVKTANIPIRFSKEMFALPTAYSFLEMYKVGNVEQLNALYRWRNSNTIASLQAPIGIDNHGMDFRLDVHEKAHGPHGLIAGMTGSGKSEFIITYILSMAINYHPDDVSFILIDYKGGGLAGAFKNDETGIKLPHLAGTITNLDTAEMNRSLVSIQSELRRRQKMFNEAREALNEGTIDIYKYQKLYHDGLVKEPISHLLIISDEFAELKAQQPDFMDQLISTARIGRSLGVHLILATQKPAGVVNDQIWSNSRFRVCLKVQEKSDSMDMIKNPDAASIKQTGRFYLQVGYNEYYGYGQSAWCGAPYIPTEKVKKKVDGTINFINDIGGVIKEVKENKVVTVQAKGEQLTNIVKYLHETAEKENIKISQLWLDKISEYIYIDKLKAKYNYATEKGIINPVIGEYDDPFNQYQGMLTLPLTNQGNTIIYGSAGSGKEMMLSTLIYSIITNHSSEEVNIYIMDFGAESLKIFSKAPHIGDILFSADKEKIANLFKLIQKEIESRKKLFADYNGDHQFYNKKSGKIVPTMLVIINNFEGFNEIYPEFEDTMLQLTREGEKYGIIFILTTSASNMIRYRLAQNFKQKLTLQLNSESDYSTILGNVKGKYPADYAGRGLVNMGGIFEFQTARIAEDNKVNDLIRATCEELKSKATLFAKPVPILPAIVDFDFVKGAYKDLKTVPIGVDKKDLTIVTYNLRQRTSTLISAADLSAFEKFMPALAKELGYLANMNLVIIDAEEIIAKEKVPQAVYYSGELNPAFEALYKSVKENHQAYEASGFNASVLANMKHTVCIIMGLDKFKTKLSAENGKLFDELFEKAKELDKYNFILVDTIDKFKKREYDNWYRNIVINNYGIWIGSSITDQFVLKLTKVTKNLYEDIGNSFGYLIERGNPTLIKMLEDTEVQGDKNE